MIFGNEEGADEQILATATLLFAWLFVLSKFELVRMSTCKEVCCSGERILFVSKNEPIKFEFPCSAQAERTHTKASMSAPKWRKEEEKGEQVVSRVLNGLWSRVAANCQSDVSTRLSVNPTQKITRFAFAHTHNT